MKRLVTLFVLLVATLFTIPSFAQEPTVTKTTWGALKTKFSHPVSTPEQTIPTQSIPSETGRAIVRPGAEMSTASYSIRVRPYAVNEFWRDPNNLGSGAHVVMFFRFNTNMSRSIKLRLYEGSEHAWLNGWLYRVHYPSPGVQEVMLFADGHFWWAYRFIYGWWGLSQRFELCL